MTNVTFLVVLLLILTRSRVARSSAKSSAFKEVFASIGILSFPMSLLVYLVQTVRHLYIDKKNNVPKISLCFSPTVVGNDFVDSFLYIKETKCNSYIPI